MTTLFIDTSSSYLNVAIIKDNVVYEKLEYINEHSKYAMSTIELLLPKIILNQKI